MFNFFLVCVCVCVSHLHHRTMCHQDTGIICFFLSRCCNSTYGKTKKACRITSTVCLIGQLSWYSSGWCKGVTPPPSHPHARYTNSASRNWPKGTIIRVLNRLCCCIGLLIIRLAVRPVTTADLWLFSALQRALGVTFYSWTAVWLWMATWCTILIRDEFSKREWQF